MAQDSPGKGIPSDQLSAVGVGTHLLEEPSEYALFDAVKPGAFRSRKKDP